MGTPFPEILRRGDSRSSSVELKEGGRRAEGTGGTPFLSLEGRSAASFLSEGGEKARRREH